MTDLTERKQNVESELLAQEHVHAVGIGLDDDGNETIVVTIDRNAEDDVSLPQDLSDSDITYRYSDPIEPEVAALPMQAEDRRGKHRPVVPGVSTGHPRISAGTVGFQLTDGDQRYIASNNHVYADVNRASIGDPLYQPGVYDGGKSTDRTATLDGYAHVEDGATVDLAWGTIEADHANVLAGVGAPTGEPLDPRLGDTLIKSGRTTGVTTGVVQQVSVTSKVNFGGVVYTMTDQVMTEDMSEPGDSGSAALHADTHEPAGLLFAGSDTTTLFNTPSNIERESGLQIVTESLDDGVPTASVQLDLEREAPDTGNITAIVYGAGEPLSGATVGLSGAVSGSATTDESGTVTFDAVPIADYTISATADGYISDTATIGVDDFR